MNQLGFRINELEMTIDKLKNVQVFSYDIGGMNNVGNAWGAFEINENSDHLWNVITDSGYSRVQNLFNAINFGTRRIRVTCHSSRLFFVSKFIF